jgi:hypothetical protein
VVILLEALEDFFLIKMNRNTRIFARIITTHLHPS